MANIAGKLPLLETINLTKTFGSGRNAVAAVDHVSCRFYPDEIVSLVGESGSGKTTFARLLLRLLPPTSGSLHFAGREVPRRLSQKESLAYWREIQAVFQDPFAAFNQFYTVRRMLSNSLRLQRDRLSGEEQDKLMQAVLRSVGLVPDDVLAKWPHQLSGGQRQRVMVARAMMLRPRLLIADEPTSMIDASSRVNILNVLLDIQKEYHMTILFITHDIGLAYYTSHRILVMQRGRLVEEGLAEQVVERPHHPYTQELLANVPRLHKEWALG